MRVVFAASGVFAIFSIVIIARAIWSDYASTKPPEEEKVDAATLQKRWDDPMKPPGMTCPEGKYAKRLMSGQWGCCDIGSICD
jgi:hypothetical protein